MIDARSDMAGALNEALERLLRLENAMVSVLETGKVSLSDVSKKQGVSRSTLLRQPWRMPGFGVPDAGNSPRRWWLKTYETWISIPEIERRTKWDLMPVRERRKLKAYTA